jgi:hypothetical protein
MKSVAFPLTYWKCPECGKIAWLKDVVMHFDEIQVIGPDEEFGCAECGCCLSPRQMKPARLNGLTHKGWLAWCLACYRAIAIPSEDLPAATKCDFCGEECQLTSPG